MISFVNITIVINFVFNTVVTVSDALPHTIYL